MTVDAYQLPLCAKELRVSLKSLYIIFFYPCRRMTSFNTWAIISHNTSAIMTIQNHACGTYCHSNGRFNTKKPVITDRTARKKDKSVNKVRLSFKLLFKILL